jgi:hypothetical protein
MMALLERRAHFARKKSENPLQNRDGHSWNGERILRIPKELNSAPESDDEPIDGTAGTESAFCESQKS